MERRASPVRTCVGCRERAAATELLRVVADQQRGDTVIVRPDPAHRLAGRGAYLHLDPACLVKAVRRHAFGRALRVTGIIDSGLLAQQFERPKASGSSAAPDSKVGQPT